MNIVQKIGLKGIWKFTRANIETDEQRSLVARIDEKKAKGEDYMPLVRLLNRICRTDVFVIENLVPTVGRTLIANNLCSASPTNTPKITHCALGSNGTAPANADTQLGTEVYRNAIASITNANNVGYATGFFTAAETTGTYAEAGIFCNGTGSANSGVLLSHVLAAITKTGSQTLTLDWALTIS